MELLSENVESIFLKCLFKDGENTDEAIIADGITAKMGFHPDRLKENESNIIDMLQQLPDSFQKSGGGGMSFLNACTDKNGNQWTGMHRMMESLFCLGMAIGKVEYCVPREYWGALPGGMPYLVVDSGMDV